MKEDASGFVCTIAVALLIAAFLVTLVGCAEAPPRPEGLALSYNHCVGECGDAHTKPIVAPVRYRDSRDAALVLMAEALAGRDKADPMAQCVQACGAVPIESEHTFQVVARSNAATAASVVDALKVPASIMAGGWALDRVMDNAGQSVTKNQVSGESNVVAGDSAAQRNTMQIATDNTDNSQ